MTATEPGPATARLAATVLLLRDSPQGLEVFMALRHHAIDFAAGALVFPGGKIAPGDTDPRAIARCRGVEGLEVATVALRVAAIREVFEECGVLLAREQDGGAAIPPARIAAIGARYRKRLDRGELGIAEMLEQEDLVLSCAELVPFAHWITPSFMPKRFDTYFFLAVAPPEQLALHDGAELVDSVWLRPADAITQAAAGTRTLVPVTLLNVRKLGASDSVADAFSAARAAPIVTVQPELLAGGGSVRRLGIPAAAGYSVSEFEFPMPA